MNKVEFLTLVGFLLFCLGIVSLSLGLVGIQISILSYLTFAGPFMSFVFKSLIFVSGIILTAYAQIILRNKEESKYIRKK